MSDDLLLNFVKGMTMAEKAFVILLCRYPMAESLGIDRDIFVYPYAFGFNHISQHLQLKGLATNANNGKLAYALRVTELGRIIYDNFLWKNQINYAQKKVIISIVKGESQMLHRINPR